METRLFELLTHPGTLAAVRAAILTLIGLIAASALSRLLVRVLRDKLSRHHLQLVRRLLYYGVLTLFAASALRELGFNLGLLLGAAGILSVAIGFASQTSASNLISGLFLVVERPFSLGDTIGVGGTTGEVLSIDALSIKLLTSDNLYVRIPNETLIKSELTNFTRFDIRRTHLNIRVPHHEDIQKVRATLLRVAERNPLCLDEPSPQFVFVGFGESSLDLQLSVWVSRSSVTALRNTLQMDIKNAFDAAGIEISAPHQKLHIAEVSEPLPVRVVSSVESVDKTSNP